MNGMGAIGIPQLLFLLLAILFIWAFFRRRT
jgi:hypothetical protein